LLVDDRAIVIVVSIEDDAVTLPVLQDVGQCVLALLDRLLAQVLAIKRDQGLPKVSTADTITVGAGGRIMGLF
jgi:hypothetical protein